jgi:ATP-binding cassette subfamily B protein
MKKLPAGKGPLEGLLQIASGFRRDYQISILAFLLKDSPAWILPIITAKLIDTVVSSGSIVDVLVLGSIALAVIAQNYPMNMIYVRRSSRATRSMAFELRSSVTEHLQKLTIGFNQKVTGPIIQTKMVRDVENIELLIQQSLPIALSGAFSATGALIVISFTAPIFLAVFGLVIPIAIGLIILFRSRSTEKNAEFRSQVENFSSQVASISSMLPVIRAHAIEDTATAKVSQSADDLRKKGQELDWLNGRFGALAWLSYQILGLLSLLFAAVLSITNWVPITAGQVVLVASYFGVLMGTAISLLNIIPSLAKGIESIRSIKELLNMDDFEENEGKPKLPGITGAIEIRNLNLQISGKKILKDINLSIKANQTIAFVGPSGSGKTTLLQCIMGLVRPTSGEVIFDGRPVSTIDMRSVRRHVGYVPQEMLMLDGSIEDNVALGLEKDENRIRKALQLANLEDLSETTLDEALSGKGENLSVGQKQRLAIARALYREPRILVLDEATSALDLNSERFIQSTLKLLTHSMTMVLVAHRLNTVQKADCIYYLEGGRIIESGTHRELLAKAGAYYRMVEGKELR